MSLRTSDRCGGLFPGLLLFLAACSDRGDVFESAREIDCLIPGQNGFESVCTIERSASPEGTILTARAPDGEFRRLLVAKDGRGVIAADGAEPVRVTPAGPDRIDVLAGEIVWRVPARVTE